MLLLLTSFVASAEDFMIDRELMPKGARAKIDRVDTDFSPRIRMWMTYFDGDSHPINPNHIESTTIYCASGDIVSVSPTITPFSSGDTPIDLAVVMPLTAHFANDDLEAMRNSVDHIVSEAGKRKQDRVAGFFDDGRSVTATELGKADDVKSVMSEITPQGDFSFLYSSVERALNALTEPSVYRDDSKKAVIVVTDAYDSYTYLNADVQNELSYFYRIASQYDITIYIILYKPFVPGLRFLFEGLSRKTGGTYREATSAAALSKAINNAWGEITGQLVLDFELSSDREGQTCDFSVKLISKGLETKTAPYATVVFPEATINYRRLFIRIGIALAVLVVAFIVFLIVRAVRRKNKKKREAFEQQKLNEDIESGRACPKCRRIMLPDWKECMFCARDAEAAKEAAKKKAEEQQKSQAAATPQNEEPKICANCKRIMMPAWKECLFCRAGIGSDAKSGNVVQGLAGVAFGSAVSLGLAPSQEEEAELRTCPNCKKAMKAHWTECLYCASDSREAEIKKQKKENKEKSNVKKCPVCKQEMKEHWTECLYCAAYTGK